MKNKNKKFKYNGCLVHRRAILHMIGQYVEVLGEYPHISDIATWMNVSKKTARKHLKKLQDNREIIMWFTPYKNTIRYNVELSPSVMAHFRADEFVNDYGLYRRERLES